jgi:hypothetical protein
MNRKVPPITLAKIHARRRRAASDEPSPVISFIAGGAAFVFLLALCFFPLFL